MGCACFLLETTTARAQTALLFENFFSTAAEKPGGLERHGGTLRHKNVQKGQRTGEPMSPTSKRDADFHWLPRLRLLGYSRNHFLVSGSKATTMVVSSSLPFPSLTLT